MSSLQKVNTQGLQKFPLYVPSCRTSAACFAQFITEKSTTQASGMWLLQAALFFFWFGFFFGFQVSEGLSPDVEQGLFGK